MSENFGVTEYKPTNNVQCSVEISLDIRLRYMIMTLQLSAEVCGHIFFRSFGPHISRKR